jgi:Ca2+-binding EF-hand superfamily protein
VINAEDICHFLRDNQVDYIKEADLYPVFDLFDKDKDGNLDFDDFLQFVLPYDDVKLRAKVT